MLKTHIILKINKESMISDDMSKDVLQKILDKLKSDGIQCGRIKAGSFCVYSDCVFQNYKYTIIVYEAFEQGNMTVIPVQCRNNFPIWRCILASPKDEELFSGNNLHEFIALLNDAIYSNKDISPSDWMDEKCFSSQLPD